MTEILKILGQVAPTADVLTDLYTVPSLTQTSTSSIVICNQSSANIVFSISVAINGASDSPEQYLYFNVPLEPGDTFIATVGISLSAGDVIRVRTDTEVVSFNAFGVEVA